jgi:hypothetical protein
VGFVSVALLGGRRDLPPLLWDQVWSPRLWYREPRVARGEVEGCVLTVLKPRVRRLTSEGCTEDV